jgi:hypothetical protein
MISTRCFESGSGYQRGGRPGQGGGRLRVEGATKNKPWTSGTCTWSSSRAGWMSDMWWGKKPGGRIWVVSSRSVRVS